MPVTPPPTHSSLPPVFFHSFFFLYFMSNHRQWTNLWHGWTHEAQRSFHSSISRLIRFQLSLNMENKWNVATYHLKLNLYNLSESIVQTNSLWCFYWCHVIPSVETLESKVPQMLVSRIKLYESLCYYGNRTKASSRNKGSLQHGTHQGCTAATWLTALLEVYWGTSPLLLLIKTSPRVSPACNSS